MQIFTSFYILAYSEATQFFSRTEPHGKSVDNSFISIILSPLFVASRMVGISVHRPPCNDF